MVEHFGHFYFLFTLFIYFFYKEYSLLSATFCSAFQSIFFSFKVTESLLTWSIEGTDGTVWIDFWFLFWSLGAIPAPSIKKEFSLPRIVTAIVWIWNFSQRTMCESLVPSLVLMGYRTFKRCGPVGGLQAIGGVPLKGTVEPWTSLLPFFHFLPWDE